MPRQMRGRANASTEHVEKWTSDAALKAQRARAMRGGAGGAAGAGAAGARGRKQQQKQQQQQKGKDGKGPLTFQQREKRKRDRGQSSRGKSFVEG